MTTARRVSSSTTSQPREWMPHIWEGCDLFAWLRLILRNNLAISPSLWYVAFIVTFVSLGHTLLRWLQEAWYGSRLDRVPIPHAPLFIIGHWRTGTTLLHELLILDPRHTYPNTYECLEPNHFLLTEKLFTRLFRFLLPSRRPMDNIPAGWERPQEDEFALCMMGQPSLYLSIAFPNRPMQDVESLDLDGLPPRVRQAWKTAFLRFLRRLTFKDARRLVLKSPTHTCRIPALLELFPDARFVHIIRDPRAVFPSTVNLWKALYLAHGLQRPTFAGLEEQVFNTFTHLYARLEQSKPLLAVNRFHELRYEDLIADPIGQMQLLYERLELGGFEEYLPRLKAHLDTSSGYKTNRYPELAPELRAEIERRWGHVIRQYGYADNN
ncbi:MAG TPA: sulfotransferase [Gemmataceae bacterium]|nr:sulfotransferase [Gemmataceae bacterium]